MPQSTLSNTGRNSEVFIDFWHKLNSFYTDKLWFISMLENI